MTIPVSISPSSAPIDPGGVEEGKISAQEDQVAVDVGEEKKKSRVHSRFRRRARSRARARALSLPPEVLSVVESEELPVVKEVELKKGGKISVEKDSSKEAVMSSREEVLCLDRSQLEEGEIGDVGRREMADEKDFGQGESKNQDDETVL
ncbi:hypothetical protein F2Q68_00037835 [Brassica cretica]|uniref:Uncharacterized protein n=1 Tax=Brassica cretica TaxID=69181 RepID=A0A3N6UG85_BRACR|nr:hypothetical protein F2Q68_00037835 [Brassica cretica]